MGYSIRRIARELNHSPHTIKRLLGVPAIAAEVSTKKLELSDLYEKRAYEVVEAVTTEDISKASLQQKAVSSGIFLDKARLMRGESTENINVAVLMDVISLIKQQDEQQSCPPVRTLPAPTAEPIPAPQQAKTRDPAPAPQEPTFTRVRYVSVLPGVHEDHLPPENPLTTGLRIR